VSKKVRQTNERSYQVRIDGKVVVYESMFSRSLMDIYADKCKENEGCYVDIVRVDTQILVSQYDYQQMKRHFEC